MGNENFIFIWYKVIVMLILVRDICDKYFMWVKLVWIVFVECYWFMLDFYKWLKFVVKKFFYNVKFIFLE